MYSVDFAEIEALQKQDRWDEATQVMIAVGERLEAGGADFIAICTNTMHRMADDMQRSLHIPILHIADDSKGGQGAGTGMHWSAGTGDMMEQDFYRGRLECSRLAGDESQTTGT